MEMLKDNGDAEVGFKGNAGCGGNLRHGALAHKVRKQTPCNQIGAGACRKGGSVGNGNSYEKQLSGTLGQICDSHGNVGQDHKGDDKFQKGTENTGGGNHGTADRLRQELTNQNTENNGNNQPRN